MTIAVDRRPGPLNESLMGDLALAGSFALLAIPTCMTLSTETWSSESGAQGPLVLATGGWLLWRLRDEFKQDGKPGSFVISMLLLLVSLAAYVFGRAFDFLTAEAAGAYMAGLTMIYARFGARLMIKHWFPFLYLAFAVPPPAYLLTQVTQPLKQFVSHLSTNMLAATGLPVSREGVTIFVGQYQLLVEDACSGMNSIIGIIAVTLLYAHLAHKSSLRYSLLLLGLAVPIAIAANVLRIITLILLTYYAGDSVAQGFLHYTAGFFLFALAILLVFALDKTLRMAPFFRQAA
jgi:exosortase